MLNARTIALKLEFHLFKKERAWLRHVFPAAWQARLRRRLRARYLLWDAREYRAWIARALEARKTRYAAPVEPGLLSILTPVWDGTPLRYFRLLAESVIEQNGTGAAEWVILDNGCGNAELRAYLDELRRYSWVTLVRSPENAGIIGGLRRCLEAAKGRYVLPVDADDWLYPDCLRVVAWWIREKGFPPLLYTDEDKTIEGRAVQPYLKPDFDPVLLLNSAYIAHLGVINRELALQLGAYEDRGVEGSPDWDLFVRFFAAGREAVHIPEVVYSWRMHPESTSDDAGSKPYIHASQKAVLQRYLDSTGWADRFVVEYSPLLAGSCDWWLRRRPVEPARALVVTLETGAAAAAQALEYGDVSRRSLAAKATLKALCGLIQGEDLICLVADDLRIDRADWLWEATGLFERFPDAVMIGGRIRNSAGITMAAGYVLGSGGECECPDRGRPALDPGYFTQMMKQRTVSAVSSQFAVVRADFLRELSGAPITLPMLGAWAGGYARRMGKRVIYSPYLSGVSDLDWDGLATAAEKAEFRRAYGDWPADTRFYPAALSRERGQAYKLTPPETR